MAQSYLKVEWCIFKICLDNWMVASENLSGFGMVETLWQTPCLSHLKKG
jgi:hypothetical protein